MLLYYIGLPKYKDSAHAHVNFVMQQKGVPFTVYFERRRTILLALN